MTMSEAGPASVAVAVTSPPMPSISPTPSRPPGTFCGGLISVLPSRAGIRFWSESELNGSPPWSVIGLSIGTSFRPILNSPEVVWATAQTPAVAVGQSRNFANSSFSCWFACACGAANADRHSTAAAAISSRT